MVDNSDLVFILVEPQYRGNVGAAARVLHNFGFTQLRLVGAVPQKEDHYLAVHSDEIMENIRTFDDLSSALVDIDNAIALTRRCGRKKKTDLQVDQLGDFARKLFRGKTAFVFGRETFGLLDEEIALCPIRCMIPTNPEFSSLNLAQAVAIVSYELSRGLRVSEKKTKLADRENIDKSVEQIIDTLELIGYFENGTPDKTQKQLQNIFMRSYTTEENMKFLQKMFHRIAILFRDANRNYIVEDKK